MKAIRNLLIFILVGFFVFLIFGWYSGFFAATKIELTQVGPFYAVCEDHTGEYSASAKIQQRIAGMLWEDGIDNYQDFGIYYDDPYDTAPGQMRSKVGRVISSNQLDRLSNLSGDSELFTFHRRKAAVIVLPYVNNFSLYAGIYKAYPRLKAFADANGYPDGPIIEILDDTGEIIFILPLNKPVENEPS